MAAEFEVYKDWAGKFRWRLQAANNEIVADSNEVYSSKASCLHGIDQAHRRKRTEPPWDVPVGVKS